MTLLYQSTRGTSPKLDLRQAALTGLAPDGGLYVPDAWPQFSEADLLGLRGKTYLEAAFFILKPFMGGVLDDDGLRGLLQKAYVSFHDAAITPLRQVDERHWILELFHGPTLAFKDIALQLLGQAFDVFLGGTGQRMTVIGATSGDTGSAAMAALAHRPHIDVFILYPKSGPSEIQRKQMTCLDAPNVHALAIDGSFDDCQALVKGLFGDIALREKLNLAAVNSINWLRILGQMVYYFVAAASFLPKPVSFSVPTGNFGNVYAAYAASQCGLPTSKLAVASNRNDILARFFASGIMKVEALHSTLSPSMDIQISSNFERLLFDLCQGDASRCAHYMVDMQVRKRFEVTRLELGMARQLFTAASVDDETTIKTIQDVYKESGILLDPHTAVGVAAANALRQELPEPVICLACAHPAKFPETIRRAVGLTPPLPESVTELLQKPERFTELAADPKAIETFILERVAP